MPVIIPPAAFDVPAIVRTATHSPGNPAAARVPASPTRSAPSAPAPRPGPQPLGSEENPAIVGPSPSPPPPTASDAAGRSPR
jgi:hypothetical protein